MDVPLFTVGTDKRNSFILGTSNRELNLERIFSNLIFQTNIHGENTSKGENITKQTEFYINFSYVFRNSDKFELVSTNMVYFAKFRLKLPGGPKKKVNIWPLFHCNKGQILTLFWFTRYNYFFEIIIFSNNNNKSFSLALDVILTFLQYRSKFNSLLEVPSSYYVYGKRKFAFTIPGLHRENLR
jgi:hypothetical protein